MIKKKKKTENKTLAGFEPTTALIPSPIFAASGHGLPGCLVTDDIRRLNLKV